MSDVANVALSNTRTPGKPQTAPSGWMPLTLENGWIAAAGERPPQVRVNAQGMVFFQGVLDGTGATADQFTTLPERFRPDAIKVSISVPVTEPTGLLMRRLDVGLNGFVLITGFVGTPGTTVEIQRQFSKY